MNNNQKTLLKELPGVDQLLTDPKIKIFTDRYPINLVIKGIRDYLTIVRQSILDMQTPLSTIDYKEIVKGLLIHLERCLQRSLKGAINGMGIVLHADMGRAPFAEPARRALEDTVANYCTLQIDPETGQPGDRYAHVEDLLIKLTGAEAALVVNNNAAATLLILNTLAGGKDVIVSREELIEIEGSFRIPNVIRMSGAILVEVGTTNRTLIKDYRRAIGPETGLFLQVHQSNYRIIGFTKHVLLKELAELARKSDIPLVYDLGSGALVDLSRWGLPKEPTVQDSIAAGADVVCFSGDKLLGGPQCGIIAGKHKLIQRMKKNQLARALRCDKMVFSVLEATLRLFLDEDRLVKVHPVLRMLTEPLDEVKKRCRSLYRKLTKITGSKINFEIIKEYSEVGSDFLAAEPLPTWALCIRIPGVSIEALAKKLRLSNPPVFGRIKDNRYFLDCRTINRDEFSAICDLFTRMLGKQSAQPAAKPGVANNLAEEIVNEVREIDNGLTEPSDEEGT